MSIVLSREQCSRNINFVHHSAMWDAVFLELIELMKK